MKIKTEKFEGPLILLLEMIEDEKLDITEVSLANIADQYINYVREEKNINPEETADFLVIAAKLLLIKSKTLLPYLVRGEENKEIKDFTNQLKIYKKFLEASEGIERMLRRNKRMFSREFNKQLLIGEKFFHPPKNVSKTILRANFKDIIKRIKPAESLPEGKVIKTAKIEEKIEKMQDLLEKFSDFYFSSLFDKKFTKADMVVSFLAMLEMIKQQAILVEQGGLFKDIKIISPQIYKSAPNNTNMK